MQQLKASSKVLQERLCQEINRNGKSGFSLTLIKRPHFAYGKTITVSVTE